MLKAKKYFTIIELLVVVAIISILAALILGGVAAARESARETQAKTDVQMLALAIENYKSTYKTYPFDSASGADANVTTTTTGTADDGMLYALWGPGTWGIGNARKQKFYKNSGKELSSGEFELRDPWGNLYQVYYDGNYDNQISSGDGSDISGTVAVYTQSSKSNDYIRSWTTEKD